MRPTNRTTPWIQVVFDLEAARAGQSMLQWPPGMGMRIIVDHAHHESFNLGPAAGKPPSFLRMTVDLLRGSTPNPSR